jgi:hypothetical protein
MLFAETFAGQFVLLSLLGLTTAVLLWRGHRRRTGSAGRNVANEVRREFQESRAGATEIHRLESRLYDFGREVEGRVEIALATLDRLIEEAGDEISRLESALERSRQPGSAAWTLRKPELCGPDRQLSSQERRMVAHLTTAGFTVVEIAHLTGRPVGDLSPAQRPPRADAA